MAKASAKTDKAATSKRRKSAKDKAIIEEQAPAEQQVEKAPEAQQPQAEVGEPGGPFEPQHGPLVAAALLLAGAALGVVEDRQLEDLHLAGLRPVLARRPVGQKVAPVEV